MDDLEFWTTGELINYALSLGIDPFGLTRDQIIVEIVEIEEEDYDVEW